MRKEEPRMPYGCLARRIEWFGILQLQFSVSVGVGLVVGQPVDGGASTWTEARRTGRHRERQGGG